MEERFTSRLRIDCGDSLPDKLLYGNIIYTFWRNGDLDLILPKRRDPRLITIRRGGTLTDSDHKLLALWAAKCAEHILYLFESVQPSDPRPRQAIEAARAWTRGQLKMMGARAFGGTQWLQPDT